jgi:hypothetical protein
VATESLLPWLTLRLALCCRKPKHQPPEAAAESEQTTDDPPLLGTPTLAQNVAPGAAVAAMQDKPLSDAVLEALSQDAYEQFDDYLEMVIEFGECPPTAGHYLGLASLHLALCSRLHHAVRVCLPPRGSARGSLQHRGTEV